MDAECAPVHGADLGKWKGKEMSVRRGADLAKWKGMSKSGKKVVAVGSYSRKRVSRKKEKGKRKGQGLKSLFPRDLELYFPSPNVNFKGISDRDYNNWHPIKVEYPLQGRRNCFEIVKGKKLEKDVVSLLSNGWRRNYLVRNNGTKESVASCVAGKHLLICCFKVPLPDNHKDAHHCRAMVAAYNALRKKNENFEMVMVAKMAAATMEAVGGGDAEAAFNHFFDTFPCLAIPFWDTESRDFLCRKHWILTVVKPEEELVYFFDPVRRRLPAFGEEWTSVVNSAIKIYKSTQDKTQRKTISWLPMLGVPEQFGSTDCGFFIMRYMKDIVEDKNLDFASKWRYMATPPHAYTPKHIDEVRVEWVRFLMKYHIK
ncbi:hypothetical protein OROGR_001796 [Orobanche gracilis]